MSTSTRTKKAPAYIVIAGFAIYLITVAMTLLFDSYICRPYYLYFSMSGIVVVGLGAFLQLILSVKYRSIKTFFYAALIALFAYLLFYALYLMMTRCPGW
jgi:uncharacterized membrane protein YcgQ (UPF0703/DUF1980 family)